MTALRMSVLAVLLGLAGPAFAEDYKLEPVQGLPEGVPEKFAAELQTDGVRVASPKGPVCEIWLAKSIPQKADFKPTLFIKYPFTLGQFVGLIRMPAKGAVVDFRGQTLPAGVFSLRYGQQPQDGNHLGTSDVLDFLLACSFDADKDPGPTKGVQDLFKRSAKASGTTHPAILLLLPPAEKPADAPALGEAKEQGWLFLQINADTKKSDAAQKVPFKIVVRGQSSAA